MDPPLPLPVAFPAATMMLPAKPADAPPCSWTVPALLLLAPDPDARTTLPPATFPPRPEPATIPMAPTEVMESPVRSSIEPLEPNVLPAPEATMPVLMATDPELAAALWLRKVLMVMEPVEPASLPVDPDAMFTNPPTALPLAAPPFSITLPPATSTPVALPPVSTRAPAEPTEPEPPATLAVAPMVDEGPGAIVTAPAAAPFVPRPVVRLRRPDACPTEETAPVAKASCPEDAA